MYIQFIETNITLYLLLDKLRKTVITNYICSICKLTETYVKINQPKHIENLTLNVYFKIKALF